MFLTNLLNVFSNGISVMQNNGAEAAGGIVGILLILLVAVLALVVYFLPAIIAKKRGHSKKTAITVLNLLLGWSFLGWIIALVWSFTE